MKNKLASVFRPRAGTLVLASGLFASAFAGAQTIVSVTKDTWLNGELPTTVYGNATEIAIGRPTQLAAASYAVLSFTPNGLTASQVSSASLNLYNYQGSAPSAGANTWTIVGFSTAWTEATATFANLGSTVTSGTVIGSFTDTGFGSTPGYVAVDFTAAYKAYLGGGFSSVGFYNTSNDGSFSGPSFVTSFKSDEAAGQAPFLSVTTAAIPEPSAALLVGASAGLVLLRRRRA